MLQDYDQFIHAISLNGDVAAGHVVDLVASKPLHVVCSSATSAEISSFSSSTSSPSTTTAPSVAAVMSSSSMRDTLIFVVTNFRDVCLFGRVGVLDLSKIAEGTPWAVRVGLLFSAVRHSGDSHNTQQQQQQHGKVSSLRLAEDSQTGKPLLVAEVLSPMAMRVVVALSNLTASLQREACMSFAVTSALRSHTIMADSLETERRRRIGLEESLEKAQAACAAAGVVAGRDDKHQGDHGVGSSRGKLQKPQSLLHPGQTIGVKRGRGVKIE